MFRQIACSLLILLAGCASLPAPSHGALDSAGFERLLQRLAEGWNAGDAGAAADCFTADAVYIEPPRKQVYFGREALFEFFGGEAGRAGAMTMRWHRVAFDPSSQTGIGEFTFRYGASQVHGAAVIDVRDGRIAQWREYFYRSDLPFDAFVAPSRP